MTPVPRRRFGPRLALAAAALAAVVLPRGAVAAAPRAPVLGGSTTVTASRTAYTSVTVPRPVDFRNVAKHPPRFTGKAYGWLLYAESAGRPSPFAGHFRMPAAEGGSVVFRLDGRDPRTGEQVFQTNRLPAGRYRLYLLTDGPGAATVTLPGLAGRATVAARTPAPGVTTTTDVAPKVGTATTPAYATGRSFDAGRSGTLLLSFDWVRSTVQAGALFGSCLYEGDPPAGRWLPGCPGGSTTVIGVWGLFTGCCGTGFGGAWFPAGRWSYGRWYAEAGAVTDAGVHLVAIPT